MRKALFVISLLLSLVGAAGSISAGESGSKLYAVVVDYTADADRFEQLKSLVEGVARASIGEPGCRRFDVIAPLGTANHLTLYEVFDDEAAFAVHAASPHFKQFIADSSAIKASRTASPGTLLLSLHSP